MCLSEQLKGIIIAFPCTWTSCSSSRMHALCAAVTTSFVQGTLCFECGQLSPSAALRSSCFHTSSIDIYNNDVGKRFMK
jgi:hypothetical protein